MNSEEIPLIIKYFKKIDESAKIRWIELWNRLCEEGKNLRTLDNEAKIISTADDFFDQFLLNNCSGKLTKAARIIGLTLLDIDFNASDAVLNWRLIHLVQDKRLLFKGNLEMMRDYSVKTT
ncbi:DUF3658 domain-containing protein [Echinicola shivajiensis]|uniref:DUF3658 domain-containing protein n=1 Tax=Echinicola shivajiensis TaxID=1035916 RepID=UPI001BFC4778|nr:DUF3658 domain-containing protein [Echinicola shivajiensis]